MTSTLDELLATLDASGVRLHAEGDRLRADAPRGVLTPTLRSSLLTHKAEILERLARATARIPLRARDAAGLPLSPAQYRLWLLDRLEGGTPRYNLVSATRLVGALDAAAVARAFAALVQRHEILRSRFVMRDGDAVQIALDDVTLAVVTEDRTGVAAGEEAALVERAFGEEARAGFDLTQPPLARVRLLRFAPDRHVLLLTMHHIVTDMWSLDIFARDFAALYAQAALEPLPVQYADYAAWQRERLDDGQLQRGLAFWTESLRGLPELLPLPTDFARPATLTYRGAAVPLTIRADLVAAMQRLGRETGTSLFMVLYGALCIVLACVSGCDDFAVGVPSTNRPRPELEDLIGFFINSLVLRCRYDGRASFRELLACNRATALAAFEHQDVPFEKVVEALHVRRDLSFSPVFQVMLSFMHRAPERVALPDGIAAEPLAIPQQHALVELDWQLRETADGIAGFLVYAADLFDARTAERLARRLVTVLECVCARPETACDAIDIIPPAERHEQLETWNATALDTPRARVEELFAEQARRTPERVAVACRAESWTYQRLADAAARIAAALRRRGAGPGTRVAIRLERTPALIAALLGTLQAGAAYVPLDPGFPPDRLAFMAEDAGVLLTIDEAALAAFAIEAAPNTASGGTPDDPMYAIYTSGSTGRPKGVVIAHRCVANFLASMSGAPGIGAEDTLLAVTTLSFDIAALELFLPLVNGARVVLATRADAVDPHRLMRLLDEERVTVMQATPATWRMLLAAGWPGRPELTILCGGEALPRDLAHALLPRCKALWNMYGPTETTVWSAIHRVTGDEDSRNGIVPIGRPIANTRIYVVTPKLDAAPIGAVGELCIGGAGVALGYLNRPALTAERFVPDPFAAEPDARMYRTGDDARFRPDGTLEFLGRADGQVKLRGFRIELGEIEAILGAHPAIAHCAVAIRNDDGGEPRLFAYCVAAGDAGALPLAALREHLRRALPEYMMPAAFVRLDRLPLTPNAKVDRAALPAPAAVGAPIAAADERPNEREAAVAALWEAVLGERRPALDANFFDLGGHSLLIVRLHQRLKEELGATCDVLDLFRHPTIRGQAALIGGGTARRDVRAAASTQAARQREALARQRAAAERSR